MSVESELDSYNQIKAILDSWSRLGSRQYQAGTLRVGHIPHVAPEAYLHCLYPPLLAQGIEQLQDEIEYDLPQSIIRFLSLHNGIGIFTLISLYGLRTSWQRTNFDAAMEQPYDLVGLNTWERPDPCPEQFIFLGSIGDENEKFGAWPNGEIYLWNENDQLVGQKVATDIFEFLLAETKKAAKLFNAKGVRLDGSDAFWKEHGTGVDDE